MSEPNNVPDADYRVNPDTGVPERTLSRGNLSRYFDVRDRQFVERRLVRRLEALGYDVTRTQHEPTPTAA